MAKQKYWNGSAWEIVGTDADKVTLKDTSNLFTATNVEGALKELFTDVSSGKNLVGTAITDVDSSVTVPTNPTFQQLANAIGGISTGKKFASGTVSTSLGTSKYTNEINESVWYYSVIVTGLDFLPSTVIIGHPTSGTPEIAVSTKLPQSGGNPILHYRENYRTKLTGEAYLIQGGFKLPVTNRSSGHAWIAYE